METSAKPRTGAGMTEDTVIPRQPVPFKEYTTAHANQVPFVYNTCFGSASFSREAIGLLNAHGGNPKRYRWLEDNDRNDPFVAWLVEEKLGDAVNGSHAKLKVEWVSKARRTFYFIREYDGSEQVEFDTTRFKFYQQTVDDRTHLMSILTALQNGNNDKARLEVQAMEAQKNKLLAEFTPRWSSIVKLGEIDPEDSD